MTAWPKPVIEYSDINSILSLVCRVRPPELRFSGRKDLSVGQLIVVQAKKTYRTICSSVAPVSRCH
jgi:hypothetical protein